MKNSFEQLGGVGIEERENTKEFSELALSARTEANSILARASRIKNVTERLEMEKQAYRIYAALDMLEAEIPESIRKTTDNLVETGRVVGFASEKSAETFLREVVGNTQNKEKRVEAA